VGGRVFSLQPGYGVVMSCPHHAASPTHRPAPTIQTGWMALTSLEERTLARQLNHGAVVSCVRVWPTPFSSGCTATRVNI
jgi:hypothetical protein